MTGRPSSLVAADPGQRACWMNPIQQSLWSFTAELRIYHAKTLRSSESGLDLNGVCIGWVHLYRLVKLLSTGNKLLKLRCPNTHDRNELSSSVALVLFAFLTSLGLLQWQLLQTPSFVRRICKAVVL